jgi:quercetin dioxygenase-like cupin family protein
MIMPGDRIRFHSAPGVGVVDGGAHFSRSDRGQVEATPGKLICVNPGEVHDGRPLGERSRSWRLL